MLRLARENVPSGTFLQADAGDFTLSHLNQEGVDAAVCAFDSVNHLIEAPQLQRAFHNVHQALRSGGCFVFDVNTGTAYGNRWNSPRPKYSRTTPSF